MSKYFFYLIILIGFQSCNKKDEKPKATKTHIEQKKLELGAITEKTLSSSVNLPGELKPYEIVQLYPKINGFVKEVLVDRGSVVKKGQVLVRMEAPEMEQQYLAAKSKYAQVNAGYLSDKDNYDRLLATSQTPGTVSTRDISAAKSKLDADNALIESENANVKAVGAMINYLTVTAPFGGVISERNIHPGALVGPTIKTDDKAMLTLEQESKLRLIVNVPEIYINQISKNTVINFRVSTLPGKNFQGKISRSSGSLNPKFRSETVEIDVDNAQNLLKPGMFAEVVLPIKRTTLTLVVPKSAIVISTERKYIITIKDGKTKWIDVQEGNSRNDSTEVFGNLLVQDKVVLKATDEIKEGIINND